MSLALSVVTAVALDRALGGARRWHPLVGFDRYAQFIERVLYAESAVPRLRGLLAAVLAEWQR